MGLASEYKSIAAGLGEKEVVDAELSQTLVKMAGHRNRFVYMDHMIGEKELFSIINEHQEDMEEFIIQVRKYLDQN